MNKVRTLLGLIIIALILLSLNVNSAFVIKNNSELANAYKNNNLIRLHIIAESNSPQDQYLKRLVREEAINYMSKYSNKKLEINKQELNKLKKHINNFLEERNVKTKIYTEFGNCYFPRRTYGDTTLPEGEYKALKIVLGRGEGSNWWCVLLPPLCLEKASVDQTKNTTDNIEFKFKLLEIFNNKEKSDYNQIDKLEYDKLLLNNLQLISSVQLN